MVQGHEPPSPPDFLTWLGQSFFGISGPVGGSRHASHVDDAPSDEPRTVAVPRLRPNNDVGHGS
jgi:hypothetical protein